MPRGTAERRGRAGHLLTILFGAVRTAPSIACNSACSAACNTACSPARRVIGTCGIPHRSIALSPRKAGASAARR